MRTIRIEKVTLNVGAGKDQNKLEKAMLLLKMITGIEPVKTVTKKRIPSWGLRPGLPIGCKITLRKAKATQLLKQLLGARDNQLVESQFDGAGNISFGIHEYIDIPGIKYDPNIGILGFQICITLQRPGFRVKKRANKRSQLSKKHNISKEDAIEFMKKEFNVKLGE